MPENAKPEPIFPSPMEREEPREKPKPECDAVEWAAKVVYAVVAFSVTVAICLVIGLEELTARECGVLNGGVAFYTREAAGRIVHEMNRIARKVRK